MPWVEPQGLLDVGQRLAEPAGLKVRRGARVVSFGKVRCVIHEGGKVFDGKPEVAFCMRLAPPLQQQVHCR